MKRKLIIVLTAVMICVVLCGCPNPIVARRKPSGQKNTFWQSEDNRVFFGVLESGGATGKMYIDGSEIDFYLTDTMGGDILIYNNNVLYTHALTREDEYEYWVCNEYEYWVCNYKNKDEFVATVKETTFFKVDEKIKFHKVDEETYNLNQADQSKSVNIKE